MIDDRMQNYWKEAQAFITKNQVQWESISANAPEFHAWVKYFQHLGIRPRMLVLIEHHQIQTIVVPAKFPQWFDPKYGETEWPSERRGQTK
jgi:hypothetical protein